MAIGLVGCSGGDDASPSPTSAPFDPFPPYAGAVVGTSSTVNGEPFVTESGTGVYYSIAGVPDGTVLGTVLFVAGRIRPVPGVHLLQATYITTVHETGSVGCEGTLAKRTDRYFVESSAEGGCGSVELIEGDPQKLDTQVGQETGLTVKYCTITKEGRMVKADLSPDFACSKPYP